MSVFSKVVFAASLLSLGAAASPALADTTLIFGEPGPNRGARPESIQWFADEVAKRSNGDLKIEIHWGGALYKSTGALDAVGSGAADLGTVLSTYFPKELMGMTVANLPLGNADLWVGMEATDEFMRTNEAMKKTLDDLSLVYLGSWTTSQVNIGCKGKVINSVDDIRGLKIRGMSAYGDVFSDLGGINVDVNVYDSYQGIETGLLDCTQSYSYMVTALKLEEVLSSYTILNWGQVAGMGMFINKDVFEGLTEDQREVLLGVAHDMIGTYGDLLTKANDDAVEAMKAKGIEVIELPEKDRSELRERAAKYIQEWVEEANAAGLPGEEMLAQYAGLVEKWTKVRDEKGYPWVPKE
ncbi:ABC transporter substrate-binding protein [Mesorhizobium sp. L-8-10]|uniref:C4-dicarboxylate TRAP transporter substrate-binding protein n=1 Tax=Mesorhizobium sp. L-8-10 TaxID=2744523 RepID=UPI0019269D83|nr:C4-dicarboxylate TRAP transporter substrate-binding protein [Mesorhizobium sp. L-8-10]BCH35772.1 ABC transporter substrate-binding protein [Mesorhizobium sp. L-8-10]